VARASKKPPGDSLDVTLPSGPERVKTSVWLDPLVWRAFRESCSKVGQSTCGVLEPFMYAFSRAVSAGEYSSPRPMTVNLNVTRQVQRVRRRGVERVYEELPQPLNQDHKCFVCGQEAVNEVLLVRADPPRVAYACAGCRGFLEERKGLQLLRVKNYMRAWVDPYDHSL